MIRIVGLALCGWVALSGAPVSAATTCPDGTVLRAGQTRAECPSPAARKFEPYDPDRMKAGSRPGFIDVGGGTEIRVGGRARGEFDSKR